MAEIKTSTGSIKTHTIRWYKNPSSDSDVLLKVEVNLQGDVLVGEHALDGLLRLAGFYEVYKA